MKNITKRNKALDAAFCKLTTLMTDNKGSTASLLIIIDKLSRDKKLRSEILLKSLYE